MGSSTQSASFTKNTSFMRNFLKVYGVVDRSSLDMVRTSHLRNEEKVFLAAYLNKNYSAAIKKYLPMICFLFGLSHFIKTNFDVS